jgi:hypothetical protein
MGSDVHIDSAAPTRSSQMALAQQYHIAAQSGRIAGFDGSGVHLAYRLRLDGFLGDITNSPHRSPRPPGRKLYTQLLAEVLTATIAVYR